MDWAKIQPNTSRKTTTPRSPKDAAAARLELPRALLA